MAAIKFKQGTALQTGVTGCGVGHAQSNTESAGGELKIYHDENGNDLAVYVGDPHKEFTFEAVLEADEPDKEIGDPITVGDVNCIVTKWEKTASTDDVKKVSIGVRTTDLSASSSNSNGSGSGSGSGSGNS